MNPFKLLLAILLCLSFSAHLDAQNHKYWQEFLDGFCEEHFKDCFDWKYIEIVSIDKVDEYSGNKVIVEGKVKNTGYFNSVYTRRFKATIINKGDYYQVNFSKHGRTELQGDYWTDCDKTIWR